MPKPVPREHRVAMGAAITFWRRDRGHKQKELAKLCKWQPGRISKYETGAAWPDDDSLRTLAEKLELPRETFYQGQEALLRHRGRVLGTEDVTARAEDGTGKTSQEVREPAADVSVELAEQWEDLERAEAVLRTRRRRLEVETQASLLRAALAR